ncbi:MAG: hypothetical protein K5894_03225 [Lachnospiraceae bacterium]|nr:hypothetical protein [Lachnospiraceae bacterium]
MDGKIRKIGLKDLKEKTGELAKVKPDFSEKRKIAREKARVVTPYFTMLDSGRDIVIWTKKNKGFLGQLPKHLGKQLLELEGMIQKMQFTAVENGFDYSVNYNECYFASSAASRLAGAINSKVNSILANEKELTKLIGVKSVMSIKSELQRFSGIAAIFMKDAKKFMYNLEREYALEAPVLKKDDE